MKSVFIVDDDRTVIQGLVTHIPWERLHIRILGTANNGVEALEKIKQQTPDILITDVYMPKMDGLQLIEALQEEHLSVRTIIHSGYDDFENARRAMKYGVQHFVLKPCHVSEFEAIIKEVVQEMEAEERQTKLQQHYEKQMKEYIAYSRDAFLREMLMTRYNDSDVPIEKLELLGLSNEAEAIVASLSLIRSPYLTKSKEREWQLLKFGAGNIVNEMVSSSSLAPFADAFVVDYTDSTFVLIFFAKPNVRHLRQLCVDLAKDIVQNLLLYLKLSSTVGIGEVKENIYGLMDSYLESQKALEAGEYDAINQVFTYREVSQFKQTEPYHYPLDAVKEIQLAIQEHEFDRVLEHWTKLQDEWLQEDQMSLFVVQTVCVHIISTILMDKQANDEAKEDRRAISESISYIYSQRSTSELSTWMQCQLQKWRNEAQEEVNGKKSHKLVREVKAYVQNHYDQEITLAEIADFLFVNRNYLSQLFKRVTGETFVNYLNHFRIERAKELLKERHYMVYEVSEMTGYQNPTYFSQVFKSITGKSPSEYYK